MDKSGLRSNCSEMNALELLIKDCWVKVLDKVKSSKDLKACSETCLVFEEILWPKKTLFLFDLILPQILDYLPETSEGEEDTSLKAILDCRLACKDWCKPIDKLEDTDSFTHPLASKYEFDSGEKTERFLQMFKTHDRNPIIGRSVTIVHHSPTPMAQPQEDIQNEGGLHGEILDITKILKLLDRFGNDIRTLELVEDNGVIGISDHLRFYKDIQIMLSRLPNVRKVKFLSVDRIRFGDNMAEMDQEWNVNELPTYIAGNPLPPLPNLESLEVLGLTLIMTRSMLEKYSSQLKRLVMNWYPRRSLEEVPRFSCLKELSLLRVETSASLECLRELHSPLEKLSLMVARGRYELTVWPDTVWPIDQLFQNIQHLPIREFEIINETKVFLGGSVPASELRLRHESIHSVRIHHLGGSVSLNFLAYCPKLAVLCMFQDHPLQTSPTQHPNGVAELFDVNSLIQEDGYDLYKSNIWEAIPSLQKLTLGALPGRGVTEEIRRVPHYHRKIYEEKRENMKDAACP